VGSPDQRAGTLLEAGTLPPRGRVRAVTAVLGVVAGFADAVGFLILFGVFTAHMSGNTTHFGVSVAEGAWTDALVRGFPIVMFVLAIGIGTAVVETVRRRGAERERLAPLLVTEVVLLVAFMGLTHWALDHDRLRPASGMFFVLAALLTTTMGLQTAVLRRVGGLTVHTTFISGMLTQVAVGTVTWFFDRRDGTDRPRDPDGAVAHTWLALGVWSCFAVGAIGGALVHRAVAEWALVVPAIVLTGLAVVSRYLVTHAP
jgi:uncharacterized membrane protein YoaK (UPF0700 family)